MTVKKEQRDGYVFKSRTEGRTHHKLPFNCPREECRRLTDTMDDPYLRQYGICSNCYITLVEARKVPLIDVDMYRKRLTEKGY
jgi:hypothetical protein